MAGLRYSDVRDDLLRKLGVESAGAASTGMLADVLEAVNYARQTMWLAGPDYFLRTPINLVLTTGASSYDLADTVQSVLGPMRLANGRTLRKLNSREELDSFGMAYLSQTTEDVDDGEPIAFFVESLNQAGGDPAKIRIHVVPAPTVTYAGTAVLEGVSESTSLAVADLAGTTVMPVPQQYTESLFLPLARKALTRSTYFSSTELKEQIEADFQEALTLLGRASSKPEAGSKPETK